MRMSEKDIFIVHTKSDPTQRVLVRELSARLEKVGLRVWQYSDWRWASPDIERFPDEIEPFLSDVQKIIYGDLQEIERGDIERARLASIMTTTPALIAFDVEDRRVTDGIEEEIKILDHRKYKGFQLGVIRSGNSGFFTRRYPYLICSSLTLADVSQDHDERELSVQLLSLFAFRVFIVGKRRQALLRRRSGEEQLEILRNLWEKSLQLIESSSIDLLIDNEIEITGIYDELLCFARDLLVNVGKELFEKELPKMIEWILDEFNSFFSFAHLNKDGFEAVLDILQLFRDRAHWAVARVIEEPMYREKARQYVISQDAIAWAIKTSSSLAGKSVCDTIMEIIHSTNPRDDQITNLISGVEHLSKYFDEATRAEAFSLLTTFVDDEYSSTPVKKACIKAIGRINTVEAQTWLRERFEKRPEQEIRLAIVLALMYVFGPKASSIALEFLKDASSRLAIILASAAWRVDTDELYDALLRAEVSQPERLSANLLYSWTRTQNPRLQGALIRALRSESMYLRGVAAVSARDYLEQCSVPQSERQEIIDNLRSTINNIEDVEMWASVASLLSLGEKDYQQPAISLLKNSLAEGRIGIANILLEAGATGFNDWPDMPTTRMLLFHPSSKIRHTMVYFTGFQRREELLNDLSLLEGDSSVVLPFYKENSMIETRGRTVAEGVFLAIKRIKGELPPADRN